MSGFPDFGVSKFRVLGLGSSNQRVICKSSHPKFDEFRSQGLAALGFLGSWLINFGAQNFQFISRINIFWIRSCSWLSVSGFKVSGFRVSGFQHSHSDMPGRGSWYEASSTLAASDRTCRDPHINSSRISILSQPSSYNRTFKPSENLVHFSICTCHPCAGAMLIFSVSFQFYRMIPEGVSGFKISQFG